MIQLDQLTSKEQSILLSLLVAYQSLDSTKQPPEESNVQKTTQMTDETFAKTTKTLTRKGLYKSITTKHKKYAVMTPEAKKVLDELNVSVVSKTTFKTPQGQYYDYELEALSRALETQREQELIYLFNQFTETDTITTLAKHWNYFEKELAKIEPEITKEEKLIFYTSDEQSFENLQQARIHQTRLNRIQKLTEILGNNTDPTTIFENWKQILFVMTS